MTDAGGARVRTMPRMGRFAPASNATTRFGERVADYIRHRPDYPPAVLASLRDEFGLSASHVIADIGSGTGISSLLFLRNGHTVIGVEPNDAMRAAGDRLLAEFATFRSVAGTAEATTLADASVDWIVAAQSFHWFDVSRTRTEFHRVLRPPGRVALLWNVRREDTPFLAAYERLVHEFAIDYTAVRHQNAESGGRVGELFGDRPPRRRTFPNRQVFGLDGLKGRASSSSYLPGAGHPRHAEMVAALAQLFDRYADGGSVAFEYETRLYVGELL